jgi:hypothetical protein
MQLNERSRRIKLAVIQQIEAIDQLQVHTCGETSINADAAFSGSIGLGRLACSTSKSSETGRRSGASPRGPQKDRFHREIRACRVSDTMALPASEGPSEAVEPVAYPPYDCKRDRLGNY